MTGLLNDLATATPIRLPLVATGPAAMRVAVVFIGMDAVPILSKRVRRDEPQNRVRKSANVSCLRREADENPAPRWNGVIRQAKRGMIPILSVMKVGTDKPQLCARESRTFVSGCRKHMRCSVL
jgi:hypothetical protein